MHGKNTPEIGKRVPFKTPKTIQKCKLKKRFSEKLYLKKLK